MKLPRFCRVRAGSVYYVRRQGDRVPWVKLGRADDGQDAIERAYQAATHPEPRTIADIMREWMDAEHDLAANTRREYERQIRSTLLKTFGKMRPDDLKPKHIAQFLDKRGGVKANRERACLASVLEWGMRKGWVESNPCRGVKRNRERPRRRYVTDDELETAMRATTPAFGAFLMGLYLTGLRQGDLRVLTRGNVTEKGLELTESKRGKRIEIAWSDALRVVVESETARSESEAVFTNTLGQPWNPWTIQTAHRTVKRRTGMDWNLHDLRAKAESDHAVGLGLMASYERARKVSPVL